MPPRARILDRAATLADAARTATLGRWDAAALLAALAFVVGIRVRLLVGTDFPINDGALFLVFVEGVARVFPHLPPAVDYNGLHIPFAYPPLSFWIAAGLVRLGIDAIAIVHVLPILLNIAWVLLFAGLLLRSGFSTLFTAVAVFVFGTTMRSYEWLVMGGGLSRGFGSVFLLLMLLALLPPGLWRAPGWWWRRLAWGGVFLGATILSHLEWGILATLSALVCVALAQPRFRAFVQGSVLLGVVSGAMVLPWLVSVLHVHGLQPFHAASQASQWTSNAVRESGRVVLRNALLLVPFLAAGAVLALRTRHVFWLILVAAGLFVIPRSGETPMVLGVGVLTAMGVLGLAAALARWPGARGRPAAIAFSVGVLALAGVRTADAMRPVPLFGPLSSEARSAMAWVAANHPGARFTILEDAPWAYNAIAEWFPVLAHATNTTTVQGREWLPERAFDRTYTAVETMEESITCEELLRSLQALPRADFAWAGPVDLRVRAAGKEFLLRPKSMADRLRTLQRRLRGQPLVDEPDPNALRGPGTAGGCFDAAGWQEVHANARVRIFRMPAAGANVANGVATPTAPVRP